MSDNTKQVIKKTLLSFLISILAYKLYTIGSFMFMSLSMVGILGECDSVVANVLEDIMSFYIIGMLVLKLHQKTEGKLVGYLESSFLIWIVLIWINVRTYPMIIFWFVLLITGILYQKVKKINSIFYSIIFFILCYSWYLNFLVVISLIIEYIPALIVTFILYLLLFSVMGYKKKRQFQRDFFIIYGIWGCIEVIGLLTGIGQELLNDFAKLGVEAILYMLEDVPFILIYLSFGFAFLIGELIAWILHIGREFEKKIIGKRNARTQERNINN